MRNLKVLNYISLSYQISQTPLIKINDKKIIDKLSNVI